MDGQDRLPPEGVGGGTQQFGAGAGAAGNFAGAIEHNEAAIAIEPGLIGVDYNLGVALERVGRVEEALRAYERAVARDPADGEARAAVVRLRGG